MMLPRTKRSRSDAIHKEGIILKKIRMNVKGTMLDSL